MENESSPDKAPEQSPAESPPQPPISPDNGGVLRKSDGKRPENDEADTKKLLRETRTIEWLQLTSNVILAAVGIVGVGIYGGQLAIMHGQLDQMVQQLPELKKSADAASGAVGVGSSSLQATIDNFHQEQRAWVTPIAITLNPMVANQPISITAYTKNGGKTPALDLSGINVIKFPFCKGCDPTRPPIQLGAEGAVRKNLGVVVPDLAYPTPFKGREPLSQMQIDAINSGKLLVVMYGTLNYIDVFRTPHVTDYCVVYSPEGKGFAPCQRHNNVN